MRVLQLGPYPPPHGGVQTNLVAIRNYLLERGIPCAVINLTRFRRKDGGDVYYPKTPLDLMRLLLKLRYDILHLHLGGDLTGRLLALSLVCCLVPGKKTVLTFHSGGYPSSPAGRTAHPRSPQGFVFRRFDRLIGVNPELVSFFQKLGVPASRTRLIYPHALSSPPPDATLPPVLEKFYQDHAPVLLTVGLLEPEYDLPLQIEVLGEIRLQHPNAGLVIIGAGSLEADLRSRIQTRPYRDHVLLCGDVEHAATLRAITACDVFLRTTLYDGDSISVREALHLGAPVVASDNRMRPPGVTLIPAANLAALQSAIEETLGTERTPRQHSEAGDNNVAAVYQVYQELLMA